MKRFNSILMISILLLLSTSVILSGCKKKKDEPITPSFIVTAVTVQLQGGGEGLQFTSVCTNTDVKLTKVTVKNPLGEAIDYNANGNTAIKGQQFDLQATNTAYIKKLGTWNFTFVGNLSSDNTSFTVGASLLVSGK
jgi:hypothetical protein